MAVDNMCIMLTLILLVLGSITAALFATQNTTIGQITIASYHLQIPMYLIVLGSLFIGLLTSAILTFTHSIGTTLEIHNKDSKIKEGKKTTVELTKRVHQLELENVQLKTELDKLPDEKSI